MNISLKNLSLKYSRKGKPAIEGVSAEIKPGLHLLLGENGAGKTSLLHIIAGLRFPTEGTCLIDGEDPRRRNPSLMQRIGFMGDATDFTQKTISRMIDTHACLYPNFDADRLREMLDDFGIPFDAKLSALSLGNRHKAMAAYIMSLQTDILLLDEPANGLDIESKETLQRLIADIATPERTIIVSTHNYSDLQNLFDSVMVMKAGRLQTITDVDTLTSRLLFVSNPEESDLEDALYIYHHGMSTVAILPNDCGDESAPDFGALYSALHSDKAPLIINALKATDRQ